MVECSSNLTYDDEYGTNHEYTITQSPMTNEISLTQQAERFLEALAADLEISEARYEQAQASYNSLGRWLHRSDSTVRQHDPQVYVQGSFGLGTVIKPITEEEDYDVDSVCEFGLLSTSTHSQKELKQLLGVEIHSYHRSQSMTKPVKEGRRCWVLDYADDAQFHMDVVPAVPDAARQRFLLESVGQESIWSSTAIAITDNERRNYELYDADWCRSNPKGYIQWFRQRMAAEFEVRRRMLAEALNAMVEDIPEYRVRTPLQSAIMILKRHRDWRFAGDTENKPISIILTTLAAHSYQSEHSIGQALISILQRMESFIERENGRFVIRNPSDPLENFADKWEEYPARADAFFDWLAQARHDFAQIVTFTDSRRIAESVASSIGKSLAERTLERSAKSGGGLLRAASAAPAGAISFPDKPRIPTEPKGFA